MKSNLVLAFPKISKEDFNRVQSIRKQYDKRYYEMVGPHFSLVFPVTGYNAGELPEHVKTSAYGFGSIHFTIKKSIIVKDSFSDYTDVFLVPEEGNERIINLHDKLYTGILSKELRTDIPYIPHIGVGASTDPDEAKLISNKINREGILISGIIDELEIMEYEYPVIKPVYKISLK